MWSYLTSINKSLFSALVKIHFPFFLLSFTLHSGNYRFNWPIKSWTHLDVGLYWLGEDDVYCKANFSAEHLQPNCLHVPFDPKKPTVIFIHGWEPYSTKMLYRPNFYLQSSAKAYKFSSISSDLLQKSLVKGIKETLPTNAKVRFGLQSNKNPMALNIAEAWRKKGWNVGIFYWNQLSDTNTPYEAEAKIYTTEGPDHMNWWGYQQGYIGHNQAILVGLKKNTLCIWQGHKCPSVQEMLNQEVLSALKNFHGPELRIVGHSLGAQLAIGLTYELALKVTHQQALPYLMPSQLVLLDPYFTPYDEANYPWLLRKTPLKSSTYKVSQLIHQDGIIVSEYLSSNLTHRDLTGKLSEEVATEWYEPDFDWWFDQMDKHSAAYVLYFLSQKNFSPLAYYKNKGVIEREFDGAASASTTALRLAQMMGGNYYWDQTAGMENVDTQEDQFTRNLFHQNFIATRSLHVFLDGKELPDETIINVTGGEWLKFSSYVLPHNASNPIVIWQSNQPEVVHTFPGGYIYIAPNVPTGTVVSVQALAPSGLLDSIGEPEILSKEILFSVIKN